VGDRGRENPFMLTTDLQPRVPWTHILHFAILVKRPPLFYIGY